MVVAVAALSSVVTAMIALVEVIGAAHDATSDFDRALVLQEGAIQISNGFLTNVQLATVHQAATALGLRPPSKLTVHGVAVQRRDNGAPAFVPLYGLTPAGFSIRPEIRLRDGRWFGPGRREVVVGVGASALFREAEIGAKVFWRDAQYNVVGTFESGDLYESGFLTDHDTAFGGVGAHASLVSLVSSANEGLTAAEALASLESAFTGRGFAGVMQLLTEHAYYERTGLEEARTFRRTTLAMAVIMGSGALLCTFYVAWNSVTTRRREFGTLRALGFGPSAIAASVLAENLLMALLGTLLGGFAATATYAYFLGDEATLVSGAVLPAIRPSVNAWLEGASWAACTMLLGSVLPVVHAVRVSIADSLRAI